MCERTSFVAVVASLALVIAGPGCAPDAFERAQKYERAGQYTRAEQVYQRIVTDQPGTDEALNAQKQLTILYIASGREPEAQKALKDLIAAFSTHKDTAAAIWAIAREFKKAGNPKKAIELHQYNVEHFPKDRYAMWSQVEITYYHIETGDFTAAEAASNKLLKVFSAQPTLSKEIYQAAKRYEKAGKIEKTLALHQYNVEHFLKDQYAMWSQVEIVKTHLHPGNNQAADAACDALLAVFSTQPTFPKEVYQLAREYSELNRSDRTLSLDKYNAEHFPNDMYGLLSKVYYHLRKAEYEAADTVVNRLLREFSGQPGLAKEVYHLTGPLAKARQFDTSVRLYQYFLEKQPQDEQAIFAQKGLALCYTELGDGVGAEKAVEKLLTGFAGHKRIAEAVYELGMYCYRSQKFDRALALHQYNVVHFPKEKYAMWSQVEIIKSYIRDGNPQAANAAYEKLLSLFASGPTLAAEIGRVADTYLAAGNLEKAEKLYTYVLDIRPDNQQILWAKAGMIKLDIARGNEDSAQSKIDDFISDFKNHLGLPEAVFSIGEQYWNQALSQPREAGPGKALTDEALSDYKEALAVWERIIKELPASIITAQAYHMAAECYRSLGQYDKMVQYCDELLRNWPDYAHNWQVLFRVGQTYRNLEAKGAISESEAEPMIRSAFQRIIQYYPDSPAATPAHEWLEYMAALSEGEQK